jgi:TatD DNase family protein
MATQDGRASVFIDSHAHLADAAFSGDRDEVISRARDAGAAAIICIGESISAATIAAEIARNDPGFVFSTAGVHPHDAAAFDASRDIPALRSLIHAGAVAVGECGLDYHYDNSPRESQRAAFSAQVALAAELRKPLVVHTRDAEDDTRAIIADARSAGAIGVLHCYTGSHDLAELAIAAGWYVSFAGMVTFKKWTDDDLLRLVPRDRLLVESDSPYLAPMPFRGKRNEPAWVSRTLAKVASARGDDTVELGKATVANARRLFALAFDAAQ